jgi:hypothetical protein
MSLQNTGDNFLETHPLAAGSLAEPRTGGVSIANAAVYMETSATRLASVRVR